MRPTTKDLAAEAGVSLATVDRVLNARAGVRKKTIAAVNAAIERIGFERNLVAATLARKRGYRFGIVLPEHGDQFLVGIIDRIKEFTEASRSEMLEVTTIRIDEKNPHTIVHDLSRITLEEYDGIAIMAPEQPQVRDAIRRMQDRGIKVIAFIANQPDLGADNFVGIDNRAAGATSGRLMKRFLSGQKGTIAVITETMHSRDSLDRRLGFDAIINQGNNDLRVLPSLETHGDNDRIYKVLNNTFAAHSDLVGLYIMGSEAREILEIAKVLQSDAPYVKIAHERTPSTVDALQNGSLDAVITQDPGHLVRSAVRILRSKCENRTTVASQEKIRIEILLAENL